MLRQHAGNNVRKALVLLVCVLSLVIEADAKKKRKGARRNGAQATGNFWSVLKITYLCVFLPMVIMFAYAIVRDPISKKVAKELWRRAKGRAVMFLGSKKNRRAGARNKTE